MQIDHQPANLTVTADASLPLSQIQDILSKADQFIPLGPFNTDKSIREIIDFNLIGPHTSKWGTPRNWILNLEIELKDHTFSSGANVMKNVAGYDLTKLFIGAQGSIGKIKRCTFKILPIRSQSEVPASSIISGSRLLLQPAQIESMKQYLKKMRASVFCFETIAVIDTELSSDDLKRKTLELGGQFIPLINEIPQFPIIEDDALVHQIKRIFNANADSY